MSPSSPSPSAAANLAITVEAGATAKVYGFPGCTGPVLETFEPSGVPTTYPFTVEALQAKAFYVTATDAAGNVSPCTGISYVNSTPGPALPVYAGRDSWGWWIKRDGATWLDASNVECDGYEADGMTGCLHAGLMRTIAVPGVTSCAGVVATDSQNALQWQCVQLPGAIKVFSSGLKEEKNLSDLVDFDNTAWRPSAVNVSVNGTPTVSSDTSVWFTNRVVNANGNNSMSEGDNVVFLQTEDSTNIRYLYGRRSSYVMKPGKMHAGPSGNWTLITYDYLQWVEGDFTVESHGLLVIYPGVTLRNVRVDSLGASFGIYVNYSDGSLLMHGVQLLGSASYGFFAPVNNLRLTAVDTMLNSAYLATYFGSDNDVRFINLLSTSSYYPFYSGGSFRTVQLANVTFANSVNPYIPVSQALVRNLVSVNNNTAVQLNGDEPTFENLVFANNGSNSVSSNNAVVLGDVRFGGSGTANDDCGNFNGMTVSGSDCIAAGSSTFGTAMRGRSIAPSYFGKVTTDDAVSPSDTNGASTFENLTRAYLVENRWRTWGFDGSAFPNSDNRSYPSTSGENVRIWDWRPNPATDLDLLNTNVCPKTLTTPGFTWKGQQILRNSWERFDDGLGDEDGLCESGEACVFSRNKGAYQGTGTLVRTTVSDCLSGTGFTGIVGYEYENP
ncbi:MAG: hypothetical protein JNG84_14945 [Archangium sp.]|nr:hypothetical protein [Archangium sp.]